MTIEFTPRVAVGRTLGLVAPLSPADVSVLRPAPRRGAPAVPIAVASVSRRVGRAELGGMLARARWLTGAPVAVLVLAPGSPMPGCAPLQVVGSDVVCVGEATGTVVDAALRIAEAGVLGLPSSCGPLVAQLCDALSSAGGDAEPSLAAIEREARTAHWSSWSMPVAA